MCEVLIVHASEASEWAEYLKQILTASCNFQEDSIISYDVHQETLLKDQELFDSCKCIILLLSTMFLDIWNEPSRLDALRDLMQPPNKIVAFLCGVSEHEADYFEHWEHWRKVNSEDEPSVYVSTVMECIYGGCISEQYVQEIDDTQAEDHKDLQEDIDDFTFPEIPQDLALPEETEQVNSDDVGPPEQFCLETPHEDQACLTIQPDRILCGTCVNIYIIMVKTLDDDGSLEVEFQSEHTTPIRMPATLANKCIVTVQSPDMAAGVVTLTLYKNESMVCSTTVKYYTEMEEICTYLEKVTDPVKFMCQAFEITSNVPESLDNLLADSLNKRMPLSRLQVFGITQIAEEDTTGNCRDMELPTLLHFSAKFGLKKLTSLLMRCPGALQAYSVMNKDGDYPNNLAEKSGFSDLRQFMDKYVETVDLNKIHMEEAQDAPENEIYEDMLNASQNCSDLDNEDIYESMMILNAEMGLCEDLQGVLTDSNPAETMLRKFFEAKPDKYSTNGGLPEMDDDNYHDMGVDTEVYCDVEEEDPYNPCCPDEIYDIVEPNSKIVPEVLHRPPAPIPRPASKQEPEENTTYISKVFYPKDPLYSLSKRPEKDLSPLAPARLVREGDMSSHHDSFAGMKTPGQRQLISLQERVKVGELSVEEAVQEFKAWQLDQEGRSYSVRFQQENIQRLRESITRRCKDKGTTELMITAPMQANVHWGSNKNVNCSLYEPGPRVMNQPPPVSRPVQRGSWQTGSTSSTSSSSSHRLSIQSNVSNSSGPDVDCDEPPDIPLPPRPTRPVADIPPVLPPPRVPPRPVDRNVDSGLNERYVSRPIRPVAQMSPQRSVPPPPLPRRTW
ncbi:phosphoinositide 3-kinase adapter protein 1 isoform X1 [Triplophysa dalaica]|uniref:phosphoinositide 3-kinase adapter protein 1 isoform X1 n=1 Tax=Triplophysa dalaica TaxID=1582913 RepID=UPI0024DF3FE9|nr:phosphoinositide 3-kinase adapter protein 1 isoform X1 [Triplophysa dalaica]XP_056616517.1 phosphoinositide 3-kinase adapter protein 1 isoform X1 [Triplophysa dalaica]XP_056616518.1 phosphoinositide 3-kinase adapter protein 1 isoform X1 [Triplophysa dalaica]